jgi:hypothetical protein
LVEEARAATLDVLEDAKGATTIVARRLRATPSEDAEASAATLKAVR